MHQQPQTARRNPRAVSVLFSEGSSLSARQALSALGPLGDRGVAGGRRCGVDPELCQGSGDLFGAGLHSEAVQGVLDRPGLAGARSSPLGHRNTGLLPRGWTPVGLQFLPDHGPS
jgi:hypothetical protein